VRSQRPLLPPRPPCASHPLRLDRNQLSCANPSWAHPTRQTQRQAVQKATIYFCLLAVCVSYFLFQAKLFSFSSVLIKLRYWCGDILILQQSPRPHFKVWISTKRAFLGLQCASQSIIDIIAAVLSHISYLRTLAIDDQATHARSQWQRMAPRDRDGRQSFLIEPRASRDQ
jgi:hypothetical protein